ncbi:MAG: hypothetical protein HY906_00605 [Deltaproteobacteria bacterium]|nr:hypothetical protein [Deltaproteobacteria bacterium]
MGEIFAALAAEAVYTHDGAAEQLRSGHRAPAWLERVPGRPRGARFFVERELLMLRWHLANALHAAYPVRDDLEALAQVLEREGGRELPKSTLVRLASPVPRYGSLARRMAANLLAWEAAALGARVSP